MASPHSTAASAAKSAAQELVAELAEAKSRIESFVESNEVALQQAVDEHERVMRGLEGTIQALKGQEAGAQSRASELTAQLRREESMLQEKRQQLEDLQSQKTKLPSQVQAAAGEAAASQAELSEAQSQLTRRQAELDYAIKEMSKGIAYYARLGLTFEAMADENVRLVFTHIDPAQPAQPYTFTLHVSESEEYVLRECSPSLPSMPTLLAELNATNNFSAFVQRVRAAFVASVTPTAAAANGFA